MSPLHLIRLPVSLPELGRWAAKRNLGWTIRRGAKGALIGASLDEGRALHHLLGELFGPALLQPFRLFAAPGALRGEIYAYSTNCATEHIATAQAVALPDALAVCRIEQMMSKPMPLEWQSGRRLGFEVRIRPVSRILRPLQVEGGSAMAKGSEIDVFLLEALRRYPARTAENCMLVEGRTRQKVYGEWLAARLAGAATLDPEPEMYSAAKGQISEPQLRRFERRRVARKGGSPEGPDAILSGNLVIEDTNLFAEKLASGIGRHKSYGYGMLLLRPAGKRTC